MLSDHADPRQPAESLGLVYGLPDDDEWRSRDDCGLREAGLFDRHPMRIARAETPYGGAVEPARLDDELWRGVVERECVAAVQAGRC